jgi:hypothetical protein
MSLFSPSFIVAYWLQAVHQECLEDPKLSRMIQQLQEDIQPSLGYS